MSLIHFNKVLHRYVIYLQEYESDFDSSAQSSTLRNTPTSRLSSLRTSPTTRSLSQRTSPTACSSSQRTSPTNRSSPLSSSPISRSSSLRSSQTKSITLPYGSTHHCFTRSHRDFFSSVRTESSASSFNPGEKYQRSSFPNLIASLGNSFNQRQKQQQNVNALFFFFFCKKFY